MPWLSARALFVTRVIKARDLTGDGVVDLLVGTTYQTQSRLFRGDASGGTVAE